MSSTYLTASEAEALESMRQHDAFKARIDVHGLPMNDKTFLRYLRARDFQFEKARDMLQATIDWRDSYGLDKLMSKEWQDIIAKENITGKLYVRGFDKEGHPLLYMKPRFENTKDYPSNVKHVVYNLERVCAVADRIMPEGSPSRPHKMGILIDYDGYSVFNAPPMSVSMEILNILQNHYPERLFKCYFINPPWIFNAFFKLINPFIDPVTTKKVCICCVML